MYCRYGTLVYDCILSEWSWCYPYFDIWSPPHVVSISPYFYLYFSISLYFYLYFQSRKNPQASQAPLADIFGQVWTFLDTIYTILNILDTYHNNLDIFRIFWTLLGKYHNNLDIFALLGQFCTNITIIWIFFALFVHFFYK